MRIAQEDLRLDRLWVIHPGEHAYQLDDRTAAWPLRDLEKLAARIRRARGI